MPPAQVPSSGTGGVSGWIANGISSAITGFFKSVIKFALNPLLDLISDTLLTTPNPTSLPRVGELWTNSWQIALACYSLLVAIAGIVVMGHESVQTRYSIREVAPRIPLGFFAAALSLFFAGKAVDLANALSHAAMSGGVDQDTAGPALRDFVLNSFSAYDGNLFGVLMWFVVVGVLVALLLTFVVRVAMTMMLVVGAPLALVCHALPQTDPIARWWWKAFGGVLAVQVAQSLALITAVRVFLTPGGFGPNGLFGVNNSGLVNVLITLALMYIVFKIPFWVLGSLRFGHGRSFVGSVVRAYVMYRTFGLLRGASRTSAAPHGGARRPPPPRGPGGTTPSPPPAGGSGRPPGGRRPPGPPLFQPPTPRAPAPTQPTGPSSGPPPMPLFQAPGAAPANAAPSTPAARPARPPGPPVFQPPGGTLPTTPTVRRPPVPVRPQFQQPAPRLPAPSRRTTQPPAPATFRTLVPEPPVTPTRRPRTNAPPPAVFSSPSPATPAQRTPPPAPRPARGTRQGGDPS
ncbi:hypothetical protein [Streptomyces sp. NBC_00696]|uniref:hypothetical protein n=1 Tax=Streptomyces sp. NBC_00696 TaxID=2903672 RepID=UPI002E32EA72|nr:hypothetical protein [Streptomyces sp. NBC_00696]